MWRVRGAKLNDGDSCIKTRLAAGSSVKLPRLSHYEGKCINHAPLALQNDSRGQSHKWGMDFYKGEGKPVFCNASFACCSLLHRDISVLDGGHSVLSPLENSISSRLRAQGAYRSLHRFTVGSAGK
jgi:hypothetical protein